MGHPALINAGGAVEERRFSAALRDYLTAGFSPAGMFHRRNKENDHGS